MRQKQLIWEVNSMIYGGGEEGMVVCICVSKWLNKGDFAA